MSSLLRNDFVIDMGLDMDSIRDGYSFFEKNVGSTTAAMMGGFFVDQVDESIQRIADDFNSFKNFETNKAVLKGDIAEFWHAGTFNLNSIIRGSKNRVYVDRSHDFGSADITSNFGLKYGLKYYKTGAESAKQQAKSVFERYKEYQAKGGKDTLDEFLKKRGLDNIDTILNDPVYNGQVRIIPKDQLIEAQEYLKRKIIEEASKRPEQMRRYQETLKMLTDRIKDSKGTESIALSKEDAEILASLAKEGLVTEEELASLGISTENLISYEHILRQAFKSGLSSLTITLILKISPLICKSIKQLVLDGEIDEEQFKKIGFEAINASGEGFIRGSVSAALTTACKSGLWGNALKTVDPSIVGAVTVLAIDMMKKSYKVANGQMKQNELIMEFIKEMYISTTSLIAGGISQSIIEIPVLGFMLGSFIGSMFASFTYDTGYEKAISFCINSGFTMFGLVEQNYELPVDLLEEIGLDIFTYDKIELDLFQFDKFEFSKFELDTFESDKESDFIFLRRGVIGINKIGYVF